MCSNLIHPPNPPQRLKIAAWLQRCFKMNSDIQNRIARLRARNSVLDIAVRILCEGCFIGEFSTHKNVHYFSRNHHINLVVNWRFHYHLLSVPGTGMVSATPQEWAIVQIWNQYQIWYCRSDSLYSIGVAPITQYTHVRNKNINTQVWSKWFFVP